MGEIPYSGMNAEFEDEQPDSLWEELVRVTVIADYAATVRRLSNYEVWKSVQLAIPPSGPGLGSEEGGWQNLRILLDELNWRHSCLEGPASHVYC